MSELSLRQRMVLAQIEDSERQMASLLKRLSQFDRLKVMMPQFADRERDMRWGGNLSMSREDLPALRKAVGRLKVTGKSVAYDYDRTNELVISVKPENEEFSELSFCYRAQLKGTRCKVETQVSTYRTLVCSK